MQTPNTASGPCVACLLKRAYPLFTRAADYLQSPLLLALRLYWGWQFFETGKGKLMSPEKVTQYFQSLHIPFPAINAYLAGGTECFGGLLLLLGLGARLISVPLVFVTIVAYMTAEFETVKHIFTNPDKFTGADPFLFMLAALVVLAFGPGVFSLDWLLARKFSKSEQRPPA